MNESSELQISEKVDASKLRHEARAFSFVIKATCARANHVQYLSTYWSMEVSRRSGTTVFGGHEHPKGGLHRPSPPTVPIV